MASATLQSFAAANDAAAATTKKLEKQAILSAYFRELEEADLRLAVRYAAGRPFASTDERTLNVGWASVSDALIELLQVDPVAFHDLVVKSGEIGEALSQLWTEEKDPSARAGIPAAEPPGSVPLRLDDLAASFDALASTGTVQRKREILRDLFSRCTTGREAAYFAKIIFREMRSGAKEGVLQAAIAKAFDKPPAEIQRVQLLVGDLEEVAILARQNALNTATFRLFHPIQFMLATPQETADDAIKTIAGRTFWAEDKLDGIRAQVHKSGDRIAIYTRTMDRTDEAFPDVVAAVARLPGDFLLDGELVPWRDGCVLPFAHIQKRLGRKVLSARILRENPCAFIAFDILYRDRALLMDKPLKQRREALMALAGRGDVPEVKGGHCADPATESASIDRKSSEPAILLTTDVTPVSTSAEIVAAFEAARGRRNEGIVLKDPESIYSPGRRGQMWLKLKTHLPTFDCVVTAAEFGHGKRRSSLSDYTFAVWDREPTDAEAKLVNVGKAYIGVTDEEIAQLTELFPRIAWERLGRVFLVQPQVVLEIACDQIQKSARHASGYALRFPRIKRIRWDKRPEDADRLSRIVEIYESTHNFAKSQLAAPAEEPEPTLFDGM